MQHITQKSQVKTTRKTDKLLLHLFSFITGIALSLSALRSQPSPLGVSAVAAVPLPFLLSTLSGQLLGCLFLGTISGIRFAAASLVLSGVRLVFISSKEISKVRYFEPLLSASVVLSTGFAMYLGGDIDLIFLAEGALVFFATALFKGACVSVPKILSLRPIDNYSKGLFIGALLLLVVSTSSISFYNVSPVIVVFLTISAVIAMRSEVPSAGIVGVLSALTLSLAGRGVLGAASGGACLFAALYGRAEKKRNRRGMFSSPVFIYFAVAQAVVFFCGGEVLSSAIEIGIVTIILTFLPEKLCKNISKIFEFCRERRTSPKSNAKILKTAHAIEEIVESVTDREIYPPGEVLSKTIETHCKPCKKNHLCWGKDYNTMMNAINDMTLILKKSSSLTSLNLPSLFAERCINNVSFAKNATAEYLSYLETIRRKESNTVEKEFLKEHYQNFSAVLSDLGENSLGERERDIGLEEKLREYLISKGVSIVNIEASYSRHDKLQISGNATGARPDLSGAARLLGELTYRKISTPEIWKNNAHWHFVVNEEENFGVALERHISPAPNEKVAGDSVRDFRTDDMLYITALSDGMGAGRRASEKSRLAVNYLEKLMMAGLRRESALRVLNSALLVSPDSEVFATLDVSILDMYSGELEFVKAGAAPSYILRGNDLARVDSRTLPVGIMPNLEVEIYHTRVQGGDIIIMLSDGILPTGEDSAPLEGFIKSFDRSTGSLSRAIVAFAKTKYFGAEADDMTAVVIEVERRGAQT